MIVKIRSRKIGRYRREVLVEAFEFFLKNMISQAERDRIKIFRLFLDQSSETNQEYGYQADISSLPGHYTLSISREPGLMDAAMYMAHEFIHLKQSLSGRCRIFPTGRKRGEDVWYWEGKKFAIDPYKTYKTRDSHYDQLPWETEAYDNQKKWLDRFIKKSRSYRK